MRQDEDTALTRARSAGSSRRVSTAAETSGLSHSRKSHRLSILVNQLRSRANHDQEPKKCEEMGRKSESDPQGGRGGDRGAKIECVAAGGSETLERKMRERIPERQRRQGESGGVGR